MSNPCRKILFVTLEPIAKQMAGPAIRCIEIAKQLATNHQVTIASPHPSDILPEQDHLLSTVNLFCGAAKSSLYQLARNQDILIIQANVLKYYPKLAKLDKYLVVDLYDPYLLSLLAQFPTHSITANSSYSLMHQILEKHMLCADFTICASEKQRDYWLGRFCALGRLTPAMYKFDCHFRKLLDVVPFGLADVEPQRHGTGIKDIIPGIAKTDFLLLWGGGIWEWFDPLTIIQATAQLQNKFPQLKLYFAGVSSPNPQVPKMNMAEKAKTLAQNLGVLNKSVFFAQAWTPYELRANILLDADVAVSAHFDLPETRFSFRTRILDYLWAGLPIITTCGDELAELITKHKAGIITNYESVDGWCEAITKLIDNTNLKNHFSAQSKILAKHFHWKKAVEPLQTFCHQPYHSPAYKKIRMPAVYRRVQAVYERGGKELIIKRSQEIFKDFIHK